VKLKHQIKKEESMEPRISIREKGQKALSALHGLNGYLAKSTIEQSLLNLVYYRVSQINGCAFCLDMHSKDLRAEGETEQRLYVMDAWREAPFYSDRERAALAWAEALTKLTSSLIPDEIYTGAIEQFSEEELIDLTMAVNAINIYNRINIAFGAPVGTYVIGQFN
jgi:AhpD family alkylhydroperoxidase